MGAQIVVGIMTPAISFLFAFVFLIFWYKRRDLGYVKHFAFGYALVGVAFAQAALMPSAFAALAIVITCCLSMASIVPSALAFMGRLNLAVPLKTLLLIVAFGTLSTAAAGLIYDNVANMAMIGCATASAMFACIAISLENSKSKSTADNYIPKILWVTAFSSFMQSVFIWYSAPALDVETFQSSSTWIIINMVLTIQLCAVAVAMAMVCVSDAMTIVSQQAMTDELSGLQRREGFEDLALATLDKAKRAGVSVSLVVCDLDHFKKINDTYGHLAGDGVIKAFGKIIQQNARSTDILGRIGGEEFALLLWNANANGANLVAQQLRSALSQSDLSDHIGATKCTASFGISQWNGKDTYRDLFALADKALYLAKHSGRDCVKVAQAKTEIAA